MTWISVKDKLPETGVCSPSLDATTGRAGGGVMKKIEVADCQVCPYFTSRMLSKHLAVYDYCDNSKKYFINGSNIPEWCLLKDDKEG